MELDLFEKELEKALVDRGIRAESAHRHITNLHRSLTDDDKSEIESLKSADEIGKLADSIVAASRRPDVAVTKKEEIEEYIQKEEQEDKNTASPVKSAESTKAQDAPEEKHFSFNTLFDPENRGVLVFWIGLIVTLPITLFLLGIILGLFAAVYAVLIALIVGLLVAMVAIVAVGAVVALAGIIYGVTQLFPFTYAGLYEIGLALFVIGVVMLAALALYNVAIRFLPWVIKKVSVLFLFVCKKLKELFIYTKRKVYNAL